MLKRGMCHCLSDFQAHRYELLNETFVNTERNNLLF
jgi:hypothetical protein